jgi:hypothetical protein
MATYFPRTAEITVLTIADVQQAVESGIRGMSVAGSV